MNARLLGLSGSLAVAMLALACESTTRSAFETDKNSTLGNDPGRGGFASEDPPSSGPTACQFNGTTGNPAIDYDGDGYALKDDCNECNTGVNKGAYDVPGNGIDEDCSGTPDDEEVDCDGSLSISAANPFDGARAIGLCKRADANARDWGVLSAKWVLPDGKPLFDMKGVGILPELGVNAPQAGNSMLFLSSGSARERGSNPDFGYVNKSYMHGTPEGYPKESPACPGVGRGVAQDGVALELKIRVPSNAKSFSYQQNFFTFEYPEFICSEYNDFFVTMMSPPPPRLPDGNIAFDQDGNPISVNNSLLQVCKAGTHNGKTFPCPLGKSTLSGTGFEGHAATGWLTTSAPVAPASEITLLWAIWDSGDGVLDSSVLIDDFTFSIEAAETVTKPSGPK